MEYHPEWEDDYKPPIPKVKKPKDPKIEEDAIQQIMQLAIYGAMMKPRSEEDIYNSLEDVLKLFKEAGLIK